MLSMQMRAIMLAISWASVSLTVTAGASRAALPQQAEERRDAREKQSSAKAEERQMVQPKQNASTQGQEPVLTSQHSLRELGKDFLLDQKQIWTSPARVRFSDTQWLVPLSGITAGLLVTDRDFSTHLSHNPNTISRYNNLSNASVGALIGGAGGMWLLGHATHNDHWRETGFLAGEAALNSLVVVEALKYPLGRDRPFQGNGSGDFFHGGTSFPSEHAAAAWSVAGVIAHEYPGLLTKVFVYGLAATVDFSRIRGQQHFPSDVLVGTVIGNLVAQNIYSRHHDAGRGGDNWRSISEIVRGDGSSSPANQGSPYVALDSWVYPALDRLIGMGYINSAFMGMRPWTRSECARVINEAGERIGGSDAGSSEAAKIYDVLTREFSQDIELLAGGNNRRMRVESVYTRFTGISGQPLSGGYQYDFGQTLINDFGRPYEEGFNNVSGFSGWATEGSFTVYVRGEYQHAPSAPALTATARQLISQVQDVPIVPPALPIGQVNHFRLLDAYVGMTLDNWQVTFGRQSLWWGPGVGGAMMFSNNAEPINMFRINRVSPFKLPSILGWLGPMRVEFFLGQLAGHDFIFGEPTGLLGSWTARFAPQPMINGQRFSFKPTPNIEFGFSRTTLFAGKGVPFTTHTFLKSIFSRGLGNPGTPQDSGDRRSGFDLTYRLPKLRNWVTFYADGFTDDEFTPVAYWDRSAWTAGIYLSHFPKVAKLDLRAEGVYTDVPTGGPLSHGFYYWNDRYMSGYTNEGNLLGSWIGREGQGAQAWTTYHFSPQSMLQLNFRHQKVSQEFIPGGGTLTDVGARGDYWVRSNVSVSASVQYERWLFPVIQPGAQRNVTAAVEIAFRPEKLFHRASTNTVEIASENGSRP
jgi:hypothetical protein